MEWDKIEVYSKRIQNLEKELDLEITDFSDWELNDHNLSFLICLGYL